jgi:predicted TIM-barrel fold metal-dependent hydrolase
VIIDTESHIFVKYAYSERHRDNPLVNHISWHEHSGDLFVQEMNLAGVDKAICASYDYDDIYYGTELTVGDWVAPIDYEGGAKYTYQYIQKYPDRFIWFDSVDPLAENCVDWIEEKAKIGLKGVKWFPPHSKDMAVDGPHATKMHETCAKLKLPVVISFEYLMSDAYYTPAQYGKQLEAMADRFPDLKIGLYHAGFGLQNMLEKEATIRTVKRFDNLYMSTALFWLGDNEYPFRSYLAIIEELAKRVGIAKLMWATDWPWTEWLCKYRQMVTAVQNHATFLSEAEKDRFLGGTAIEFLNL